jgi:SAM-dependent methyltransferase
VGDTYTHGHHESVLRNHRWRTAENSAGYLLPFLSPGLRLLDVGCGPGTITLDLAGRVAPGGAVGVDREPGVVAEARRLLESRPIAGVEFRTADAYALGFDDESFDVVHAHQLLQHLSDPVAALLEMRRVLRPGGVLAVRDGDYGGFVWAPSDPLLDRWMELYHDVCRHNGADADAGRRLLGWAQAAGFAEIHPSSSTWTFADPDSRRWWGEGWADRVVSSSLAEQAVRYGLSNRDELQAIAGAWRHWVDQHDAVFIVLHGELIARRWGWFRAVSDRFQETGRSDIWVIPIERPAPSKHGVFTHRLGTPTNDFFVNLLDMDTEWKPSASLAGVYEGSDRGTGEATWTGTAADLVFGSNSQLRAIAEVYAADDAADKFVQDFISAGDKVMSLDRFHLNWHQLLRWWPVRGEHPPRATVRSRVVDAGGKFRLAT